jgi:hypothetical protein
VIAAVGAVAAALFVRLQPSPPADVSQAEAEEAVEERELVAVS